MFGKSKKKSKELASSQTTNATNTSKRKAPSVISSDMYILGNVVSDGFIDIDGQIDGNVKCDHAIVRESGKIKGDLVADCVQIYGRVDGLVNAKLVNLYQTAYVIGTIMHETLSIEDGAFVDGKFKRINKPSDSTANDASDRYSSHEESDAEGDAENIMDNLRLIS